MQKNQEAEAESGLIQWSGSRKEQLIKYAESKGTTWQDVDTQVEFLITEINGTGPANGYAESQWLDSADLKAFKNSQSSKEAATIFCNKFERPGVPELQTRIDKAIDYYDDYKGREVPSGVSNAEIAQIGIECHKFFEENYFYYDASGNQIPYPNGTKHTDCSSFVTWVLYRYGYTELKGNQLSMSGGTLEAFCQRKGFAKVNISQIKAGDILIWPGHHTEIVKTDGDYKHTLNCGSTEAIRDPSRGGYGCKVTPSYAYRPKR